MKEEQDAEMGEEEEGDSEKTKIGTQAKDEAADRERSDSRAGDGPGAMEKVVARTRVSYHELKHSARQS